MAIGSAQSMGAPGVEFAVIQAFRGPQTPAIVVASGGGCGYSFKLGESYFVYARNSQGVLTTSICTRTRPLRDAADDLAYMRSLSAATPGAPARVLGTVQLWEPPILVNGDPRPMAGKRHPTPIPRVRVTASGEGGEFETRTNELGEFELAGLPAGRYEMSAEAPVGYAAVPRAVELFDPRGCGRTDLVVKYDGRVTGRVVDTRGRPLAGIPLDLVPPADVSKRGGGTNRVQAWTAASGEFELRLVPKGEYVLGFSSIVGVDGRLTFPRAFYPGVTAASAAHAVLVSAGERVHLRDFVVPETISLVTVNGTVVDEEGRPVHNASIALTDDTEGPNMIGPPFVTADDGRFAFSLVEGSRYELHVTRYVGTDVRTRDTQVALVSFKASAATPPLTVVMRRRTP